MNEHATEPQPRGYDHKQDGEKQNNGHHHPHPPKEIVVTIDTRHKEIPAGKYTGATLKQALGVPADYDLDQVLSGEFIEITDSATIVLEKGGEHFVSHARRGGSS
jgi:hypothetical protein